MSDETQTATTEPAPAPTGEPNPPAPSQPSDAPNHGFDWQRLETRLAAFGEQITSGIREAFPQPAPAPAPSTVEEKPVDDKKEEPKSDPAPAHPTPGEHGGNRFASWWFGSKR